MQRSDYLFRKAIFAILTLVITIVFNFFLFRIMPGDPVAIIASPRLPAEVKDQIYVSFGLDKPTWLDFEALQDGEWNKTFDTQFFSYLDNLAHGDLGYSFAHKRPVSELLSERIWRTVALLMVGQVVAIVLGTFLGIIASWRRASKLDTGILLYGLFTWSMPTFFFGIILVVLARGILPTGRMVTVGLSPSDGWDYWVDVGRHLILPTIVLGIGFISSYMLVMRASVVEILSEDYILVAKAKGLSTFQIFRHHVFKNAMLPMVTMVALTLGYTVSGSIQVETVFSWPGLGLLMYEAVSDLDYPVLQGSFIMLATAVILANFVSDIAYTLLDPRVSAG
jgi:peptide/nickel transport system permease protein